MIYNLSRPRKILYVIRGVPWAEWTNSGFTRHLCISLKESGCLYGGINCDALNGWELHGESFLCKQVRRVKRRIGVQPKRWSCERDGYLGRLLHSLPPQTPVVYHYILPEIDPSLSLRRFLFQDLSLYDAVRTQSYGHIGLTPEQVEQKAQLLRRAYEQVEGILTYSTYAADSLTRDFGFPRERITAIGCGPARSIGGIPTLERYEAGRILFIGRRWEQKGGPILVKAFEIVHKALPHTTLHIVGPSCPPDDLIGKEGIRFHGLVDNKTLRLLFADSSMFVMPVICEAWGMVFTEALDAGLPIAGFNEWALPDIVEDGQSGLLTSTISQEGLAEIMIEILNCPERMLRMAHHGQRRYREFLQWNHVRDRLLAHVLPEVVHEGIVKPLNSRITTNEQEGITQ